MRAAVVTAFDRLVERPVPEPGEDQVLVRVEASRQCHAELGADHLLNAARVVFPL